jgi:hypothetical protein
VIAMGLIKVMKSLLNNIYLVFTNPKKLFSHISEKENLKNVFILVCLIGLTMLIYFFVHTGDSFPKNAKTEEQKRIFGTFFPFFMGFMFIVSAYIVLIVDSLLVKVILNYFKIKKTFSLIMSVLVYTYVPLLSANFINILWPHFNEKLTLRFLLSNGGDINSRFFPLLNVIGVFGIWGLMLQVLAVSSVGGISYKKSSLVVSILWIVTTVIPALLFRR